MMIEVHGVRAVHTFGRMNDDMEGAAERWMRQSRRKNPKAAEGAIPFCLP
jgi:hypothetical protein